MRPGTRAYQKFLLAAVVGDLLASLVAYAGAFLLRVYVPVPFTIGLLPLERFSQVNHHFAFLLLSQVGFLYFFGFYDPATLGRRGGVAAALPAACALQTLFIVSIYFFGGDPIFPRSVLFFYWLLNAILVAGSRALTLRRFQPVTFRRIVLVGRDGDVAELLQGLGATDRSAQYRIVGWIASAETRADVTVPVPRLGTLADVLEGRIDIEAEELVILSEHTWKDRLLDALNRSQRGDLDLSILPSHHEIAAGRLGRLRLRDIPLTEVTKRPEEDLRFLLKAALDRFLAFLCLLLLAPLLLAIALLIRATSGAPVIYAQTRVGRHQSPFTIYKFRTMITDAEPGGTARLASERDSRVMPLGRWLRATRIDELPQLFNVLNGTMSLVGPRPERPEFVQRFLREVPAYYERFRVKPGITGLAQVNGRYLTHPAYKLKYDIAYIYHYSLWLDVKIIFETVRLLLTRRGSEPDGRFR